MEFPDRIIRFKISLNFVSITIFLTGFDSSSARLPARSGWYWSWHHVHSEQLLAALVSESFWQAQHQCSLDEEVHQGPPQLQDGQQGDGGGGVRPHGGNRPDSEGGEERSFIVCKGWEEIKISPSKRIIDTELLRINYKLFYTVHELGSILVFWYSLSFILFNAKLFIEDNKLGLKFSKNWSWRT